MRVTNAALPAETSVGHGTLQESCNALVAVYLILAIYVADGRSCGF